VPSRRPAQFFCSNAGQTGTFWGALESRSDPASEGRLVGIGRGEIEVEDGMLRIRRIHVTYQLEVDPDADRKIRRAFDHHMPRCPVYRSIGEAIDIATSLVLLDA
jgi:hypothetical protein